MHSSRLASLSLALLTVGVFASVPAARAGNIIGNPGFETGSLGPWAQGESDSSGELWNVTTANPHTGQFSATCTGDQEIIQTFAPIATNSITSITFYEAQTLVGGGVSEVDLDYSDGTSDFTAVFPTTSYTLQDVTSTLTPGKFLTGFALYGATDNSANPPRTYLDDVQIVTAPVPEASTTMSFGLLLTLGLGALIVTAKRKKGSAAA